MLFEIMWMPSESKVDYRNPYLNLANETAVAKVLAENFADLGIS